MDSRPLVGRATELELLERALRRAQSGVGSTVLVAGDAGIGKTRLARELMARARDAGAQVLSGRGVDLIGADLPFLPLVEALRPLGAREDLRTLLGEARELPQLLPALAHADGGARASGDRAISRLALFEELLELFARLSWSGPVLLVLDDLHWADDSTLDAVAFLAHNLAERRVVVVGTYRADEGPATGRPQRLAAELLRARAAEIVELGPLARDELAAVLAAARPERSRAALAEIAERSEGNPFFAEELLAVSEDDAVLPRVLRDVLLQRVARLDRRSQQVVRIAAAAGRAASYRLLAAVAGLDERELQEALRRAAENGILLFDQAAGTFRFRHALLAEAVYTTLVPGEREALHGRLGEVLAAQPELGAAAELAHHWAVAGRAPEALAASVHAAREAEAMAGFAEAMRHAERVSALWAGVPEAEQLAGLDLAAVLGWAAELAALAGDARRAVDLAERALATLDERDTPRLGMQQSRLARFLAAAGDYERSLAAFERAVELVPAEPASAERARVLAGLGRILMLHWRHAESLPVCEAALAVARSAGARDAEFEPLELLGVDLCYLGRAEEGLERLEAARRIAVASGGRRELSNAHISLSDVLTMLGRPREGARVALEGLEEIVRLGVERSLGTVLACNACEALHLLGEWDRAAAVADRALSVSGDDWRHTILVAAARVAIDRGDLHRARSQLEEAHVGTQDARCSVEHAALVAELALLEGRPDTGREEVDRVLPEARDPESALRRAELCALGLRIDAERVALARVRRDADGVEEVRREADALLVEAHEAADEAAAVTPVSAGWRALAEAEHSRVTGTGDAETWAAAAEAWQRLGQPYRAAYCRRWQAEALVAAGATRLAASVPAREAYTLADRLGAVPLRRELELLAQRTRLDLAPPAPADGDGELAATLGLTPRELEVLGLLADGLTNREIAEALVISIKTVGIHVTHILRKLDVSTRVEAAAIAHRVTTLST
jgi:DNA-binding CsgD family transcriptional regulator